MTIQELTIHDFMTLQPQSIEGTESLAAAGALMARFGIRHLPVTTDGVVVGILSDRDVNRAYGLESDAGELFAVDVCSGKPYFVHPGTPLREAVGVMAREALGAAVVMENAHLVGIFTTVDACRVLHDLLEEDAQKENLRHFRSYRRAERRES